MKKTFTLTLLALFALIGGADAQDRKWDFTNWSDETVANLKADAAASKLTGWSDVEKKADAEADGEPTAASKDNCFWMTDSEGGVLKANGVEIAELKGLTFNAAYTVKRNLAIAVNYPSTSLGDYAGGAYLWLGGSKMDCFTILDVKVGAKISMEVESHKMSDARGVSLKVNGNLLKDNQGNTASTPTAKTAYTWTVTAEAAGDAERVDVVVYNTNGCHIYNINVRESAPAVENAKIAYFYDSQYEGYAPENDIPLMILSNSDRFSNTTVDDIDVSAERAATLTRDDLAQYDVIVVSSAVKADNAFAATTLKKNIGYVPMLNLNAQLYKTWGYGEAVTTNETSIKVSESKLDNQLFKPSSVATEDYVAADGTLNLINSGALTGVSIEDGFFAKDDVMATVGNAVAIHKHSADRNAYLYMPYAYELNDYNENVADLLTNGIIVLFATKAAIPVAAKPTFKESYRHLATDVSLSCGTKGAEIYYTTDGTDPTDASTRYTEPISVTVDKTQIKAIAYAEGYNPSAVADSTISIYTTTVAPVISVQQEEGKSTVTITTAEEGAAVYYNTTNTKEPTMSVEYTEPIVVTYPVTIYAYTAAAGNKKESELVSQLVEVKGRTVRDNLLSHFDANGTDWSAGQSKNNYYTEGGKNGYDFYTVVDSVLVQGSEGQDSMTYVVEPANNFFVVNPGKGWEAATYGQGFGWENTSVSTDLTAEKAYRPETALDAGWATNGFIQFGNVRKSNKTNGDPYSGYMQSTEAFQGPIDIVCVISNGSSSNHPRGVVYVSSDTTSVDNWVKLDTVWAAKTQRWHKVTRVSYEGTEKVWVKVAAAFSSFIVNDIYVMNNPDEKPDGDCIAGNRKGGQLLRTETYSLNGMRTNGTSKGVNIVRMVYADGTTQTRKVVVK